ncbi:MAG TPA: 1-aminocyclopropane-1-carboxylate synthase, partial [Algoriphagus sp.]|nr:1-aminocyclopropane-1-carboxylate synthase [Algoriphagus sp.]
MSDSNSLSQKGKAASENPMRIDLEVYFDAMDNIYHAKDNPTGTFPMNIAENQLCWEMLKEKMQEISAKQEIPDWVTSYGDPSGVLSFREAIASYYSDFLMNLTVDPETLALSVGATSVIEMTAFLLAEPGDTAVIPAPSYPVYTGDIGVFPSVKRYDLH